MIGLLATLIGFGQSAIYTLIVISEQKAFVLFSIYGGGENIERCIGRPVNAF